MTNEKTVSVLNDLLKITNDRIEGFSKVEDKVWETYSGLKSDYDDMVSNSQKMKSDLVQLITERGGEPENTTTAAGAIHRAWIDIKSSFAGNKDESTLENVVFGEDAAIKAYQDALDSGDLCTKSSQTVQDQLHHLKASYNKFENLEQKRS
ncbi:ferritin-like domain-containing protein [Chryseobacterium chendengshani]|uniref:ferritin-like domain-containing protein n=1 Tax=unclassified Chryseobacterium TaxID=2593645 RepID=UPI001C640DD7|nr:MULTISPECIES: PA2169 family four-helix-bundle protein [unclassified Chryseobacterium]MBW7676339.1 PA2169 family four-helix-bundle protein [Chryseobacterium sp. LJ756]MBW8523711.1 PA2169 family four-helix-bundle protein [Chryseobacterium sp. LJ668]QYK16655.1 PA2169 family four-helix-bundle protein [Chryseobacterium sp. LJ668]